jgi:anthraniloyl-CoA monooxygenase
VGVTGIDGSAGEAGAPSVVLTGDSRLALSQTARSVPDKGLWGCVVAAPGSEAGLPAARARLDALAAAGPVLAAVHGGTPLTRVLLCEHARFARGLPALLIEPDLDIDRAVTTILSGRADLVGVPPETADAWRHDLAGGR